jgi:hypothetical protein
MNFKEIECESGEGIIWLKIRGVLVDVVMNLSV